MAKKRMGYTYRLYYNATAGSTASTAIERATDIDYENGIETGSTMDRGDGSAPPIATKSVTARNAKITWKMLKKESDTALADLVAAARGGTPIALKCESASGTGDGYEGDVILTCKDNAPLTGEQSFDFTAEPNDDAGVAPQLNT